MTFETGTVTVTLDDEEDKALRKASEILVKLLKGINTYNGNGIVDEYGTYFEKNFLEAIKDTLVDLSELRGAEIS